MNGKGVGQTLVWIGSAIGISVMVTWVLLQAHTAVPHPRAAHKDEVKSVAEEVKEIRKEQREDFQRLLERQDTNVQRIIDLINSRNR